MPVEKSTCIDTCFRESSSYAMALALSVLLVVHFLFCLYGSQQAYTGNFDTGTVALMAVNIAHGTDYPLFWYGQLYFGALESYVAAMMMKIFGFSELKLSLSPILFSQLWILGTYFLYREMAGRRAGFLAAVVAAFSGYFLFYYDFTLTGGYAAILALGTWILWSGVRVHTRPPSPGFLWLQVLFTSLLAAIGIWVHYIILPSLLVAAVYFFIHLVRSRFSLSILCSYAVGVGVALLGFVPGYWASRGYPRAPSMVTSFTFSWDQLSRSLDVLFGGNFSQLLLWNFDQILPFSMRGIYIVIIILLLVMLVFAALEFVVQCREGRAMALSAPLLFLLFFSMMYLPHIMSTIPGSPRYVFNLWALIICTAWSCGLLYLQRKGRWGKILGYGLLCVWLGYQVTGSVYFVRYMAIEKKQRVAGAQEIISFAQKHGLESFQMVGTKLFGFEGQVLSMFAENKIKFVHAGFERYAKNGQAVETDTKYGILCQSFNQPLVAESLRLLGVHFKNRLLGGLSCFYDFQLSPRPGRAIATDRWKIAVTGQVQGNGDYLRDTIASTVVAWKGKQEGMVVIDLGTEQRINKVWFVASHMKKEGNLDGLPGQFTLELADSKGEFHPVLTAGNHIPSSYVNGERIYLSGYFGLFEAAFQPESSRYLRIRFPAGQRIRLSEIMLFEPSENTLSASYQEEFAAIERALQQEDVDVVLGDRWLSGKLMKKATSGHLFPALPRYNHDTLADGSLSRVVIPRQGMVLAPAVEVADVCRRLLEKRFGHSVIKKYQVIGRYGLLFLNDVSVGATRAPFLYWNGHMLVMLEWYDDLAPVKLADSGLIAIRPAEGKSKGFYYDSWTNGHGIIKDLDISVPDTAEYLVVYIAIPLVTGENDQSGRIAVTANRQPLEFSHYDRGAYFFHLDPASQTIQEIEIMSASFTAGSPDNRQLGVYVPVILIE